MADTQKGGKKNRKLGRDAAKCLSYKTSHRREANKIKRMLQSNVLAYAEAWAAERGVSGMVKKAMSERGTTSL